MTKTVAEYTQDILDMIRDDIANGRVPRTLDGWSGLEGHVDANEYLIDAKVPWGTDADGYVTDEDIAFTRAVQDAVEEAIKAGAFTRPRWGVWSGGHQQFFWIGAEEAKAQEARQEYVGPAHKLDPEDLTVMAVCPIHNDWADPCDSCGPPDGACATCGRTSADMLEKGTEAEIAGWTFHHDRPGGIRIVAETCGGACADAYEAKR